MSRTAAPIEDDRHRWTRGRVLASLTVVTLLVMWGYVLYLAFGPGRQPPPDRLDDPAFAVEAQEVCDAALTEVAQLPRAVDATSAAERAGVVASANERLTAMVDDLEQLVPPGEDGEIVTLWLADWRTYLEDRAEYAEDLRSDPEARLFVTARDQDQVTEYINAFAADNKMPACSTPLDVS